MKKLALLLIALLALSCLFVACAPEPEPAVTDPASPEVGEERLIEQGSTPRAPDHTGFNLNIEMTSGGDSMSLTIGGKDDVFWLTLDPIDAFFCEHEGKTYMYRPAVNKWVKVSDASLKDHIFNDGVENILFIGSEQYKSFMEKTGNESRGGRACTTYSLSYTDPDTSKTLKAKVYIDIEYGFTLGIDVSEGKEFFSFTVTPTLSNPELPTGYEAAKDCDEFAESLVPLVP